MGLLVLAVAVVAASACVACGRAQSVISVTPTRVFSAQAATACGEIRTPELVATPSGILLFGQCRKGGAAGHGLQDDMRETRIVLVNSTDAGKTWSSPPRFLTPIAHSVAVAVYDRQAKTVVLQYQNFTSANPYEGNRLLQTVSRDDGRTWAAATDITRFVARCNSPEHGMVCGAAGTRLQTREGRLVFGGHNGGRLCVWYSDDGGATYESSEPMLGNEFSLAQLQDGTLYMNGRGTQYPWAGNRTVWTSADHGATFSPGRPCSITEPDSFGCDGALATVAYKGHSLLIFSEPAGPKSRVSLRLWCSRDQGASWARHLTVNVGQSAAYSAMLPLSADAGVLVVWEQSPNMLSHAFALDWCLP